MIYLPNWVYDLINDLEYQQDIHPKLYFTSGAFEGYRPYDWCPCNALAKVPFEVRREATVLREYLRSVIPETLPTSTDGTDPRAETDEIPANVANHDERPSQ